MAVSLIVFGGSVRGSGLGVRARYAPSEMGLRGVNLRQVGVGKAVER